MVADHAEIGGQAEALLTIAQIEIVEHTEPFGLLADGGVLHALDPGVEPSFEVVDLVVSLAREQLPHGEAAAADGADEQDRNKGKDPGGESRL